MKYIGEKNRNNQTTSFNKIADIWENIHRDYQQIDLNANIRHLVELIEEVEEDRTGERNVTLEAVQGEQRFKLFIIFL